MKNEKQESILRDTVNVIISEMEAPEVLLEILLDAMEWSHDWFRNKQITDRDLDSDNHFMLQTFIWEVALPWLQSPEKPPLERMVRGLECVFDYMDHEEYQRHFISFMHLSFTCQFESSIISDEYLARSNRGMGLFMRMNTLASKYYTATKQLQGIN